MKIPRSSYVPVEADFQGLSDFSVFFFHNLRVFNEAKYSDSPASTIFSFDFAGLCCFERDALVGYSYWE